MSTCPSTSGSQTLVSSMPAPPEDLNDDSELEEGAVVEEPEQEERKGPGQTNGQDEEKEGREEKEIEAESDEKCDKKSPEDENIEKEITHPEPSRLSTPMPEPPPPTPPPPPPPPATIFLTGATGFLGKVVLSELLRQSIELAIIKIIIFIRPKKKKSAKARFLREVYNSPCFSGLASDWPRIVQVVEGDVAEKGCGPEENAYEEMCGGISHVVHCAGSNKFGLPIKEAVNLNVESTMNLFELARSCLELKQLVITSSAYASPNKGKPIREEFVSLPLASKEMLMVIEGGRLTQEKLSQPSGHQHSHGLSWCVAENFVRERMGELEEERDRQEEEEEEEEEEERMAELERVTEMERESVEDESDVSGVDENVENGEEANGRAEGKIGNDDENGTKDELVEKAADSERIEDAAKHDTKVDADTSLPATKPEKQGFFTTIIRPSLLGPSKQYPYPGWCEGDGLFISLMGCISKGALRVLDGDPSTPLNVVPVDEVVGKLIEGAFPQSEPIPISEEEITTARGEPRIKILFATTPINQTFTTRMLTETTTAYFHNAPAYPNQFNKPKITYVGLRGGKFKLYTAVHQKLPVLAKKALCAVRSDEGDRKEVVEVEKVVAGVIAEAGQSGILRGRGWDFRLSGEQQPWMREGSGKKVGEAEGMVADGFINAGKEDIEGKVKGEKDTIGDTLKDEKMDSKKYLKIICEGVEKYILLAEKGR